MKDPLAARAPQDLLQRRAVGAGPVQRAKLSGVRLNTPYANPNENGICTHMAGEWNGNNDGAVTGGHLRSGMVTAWGAATYGTAHDLQGNYNAGVHFTGPNTLPAKINGGQHEYFLSDGNHVSKKKSSTFWPRDWSEANFRSTLQNSYATGNANTFASKANTSYWYTWQTLGANTVFPVAMYADGLG